MTVVWAPLALDRISEIAGYIAQDKSAAASEWVESVFARVAKLSGFPGGGRVVPEMKRADVREIIHGNYRIIYRVRRGKIVILTVRHGRQRLSSVALA